MNIQELTFMKLNKMLETRIFCSLSKKVNQLEEA